MGEAGSAVWAQPAASNVRDIATAPKRDFSENGPRKVRSKNYASADRKSLQTRHNLDFREDILTARTMRHRDLRTLARQHAEGEGLARFVQVHGGTQAT